MCIYLAGKQQVCVWREEIAKFSDNHKLQCNLASHPSPLPPPHTHPSHRKKKRSFEQPFVVRTSSVVCVSGTLNEDSQLATWSQTEKRRRKKRKEELA